MKIAEYKRAKSIQEAWELNRAGGCVLGGGMWLRQGNKSIETAIDLSDLGLDAIRETDEEFEIGAMVSLQQLMKHEGFAGYTNGAVIDALKPIVGVQFRNMATVGGSLFARLGFSDVLTLFMVLDARVRLYQGFDIVEEIAISDFAEMKRDDSILMNVIVKKTKGCFCYSSVRRAATDFPILACAAAKYQEGIRMAFGERPGKAVLFECGQQEDREDWVGETAARAGAEIKTGSNGLGSSEYRTHLVKVMAERSLTKLAGGDDSDC